jgi:hypothetical protein
VIRGFEVLRPAPFQLHLLHQCLANPARKYAIELPAQFDSLSLCVGVNDQFDVLCLLLTVLLDLGQVHCSQAQAAENTPADGFDLGAAFRRDSDKQVAANLVCLVGTGADQCEECGGQARGVGQARPLDETEKQSETLCLQPLGEASESRLGARVALEPGGSVAEVTFRAQAHQ